MSKLTISAFAKMKEEGKKVTFITAYDAQMSRVAQGAGIDMILVGDSVGNNVLGYTSTHPVTMDDMIRHSSAARRGALETFVIGDLPFLSYQTSNEDAIYNAGRFIKESGMDAVKCEGGRRMAEIVRAINDAGIAVMGHIGYTPQSTNFKGIVQSKSVEAYQELLKDARALQDAGAFAILLEAVPNIPAGQIAKKLDIPIYGIGSGREVDGVLAIINDVIGFGTFKSKFVKNFCNAEMLIKNGIEEYITSVRKGEFPSAEHFYSCDLKVEEEIKKLGDN